MLKMLIWLVCVFFSFIFVWGQTVPMKNSTNRGTFDTINLSRPIFEAIQKDDTVSLADYLAHYSMDPPTGQPDSRFLRANSLLYKALSLSAKGNHNLAADSLLVSITIRPANGMLNQILLADSYGKLARLYKKTGEQFESSRNFERSINLNRKLGRKVVLAEDLSDWSSVLSTINKSDPNIDSALNESFLIYSDLRMTTEKAQVLNEFGVLFYRRGKKEESLKSFKQSLQVKSEKGGLEPHEFIAVNSNIGLCYEDLDNYGMARLYFLKAIDYARLSKDLDSAQANARLARLYANMGASYGREGKPTPAIEYFQKALNCLDSSCSLTDFSTNPSYSKVNSQLAEYSARKAFGYHERYRDAHNPADLIIGLNTFMVALGMMDTLRFMYSFDDKPILSSEAKIHFYYALDMALNLNKQTGEKKYLDSAFRLSERNKSSILNEFLRTNQAREYMGQAAPWIAREDSIKQLINKIKSELISIRSGSGSPTDSEDSMRTRESGLTDELRSIGITAKRESPEYFKMAYSNRGYPPEEIQKLLVPGEALVDYTILQDARLKLDNMIVIVLTSDTLFTFQDTLPQQFRQDIVAFRASISPFVDAKVFQEFSRLANLMYLYFFAPVEKFQGINKLIILPDEELGFLPFEAFVSDTIKTKGSDFRKLSYLNRKYQISYISSHEQLFQFRSNQRKREKSTVYAFAPFMSEGARMDTINVLPLENSGKDIKYISKYFRTKTFKNRQAGELSLRRAFQRESVISLSTHGIVNTRLPMQSRLLLNPSEPDGSLYLFEMMSIKIRSSLVILNACNTGTGKLQVGEGIMSMARGFQFAGVPSVITTLWPIDDKSSATVMKYFFQNLNDGLDQREALCKARNSYIDQATKATSAPYFWAGHVLIGNPGILSIHRRINPLAIEIPIILVVMAIVSLVVFYKKVQ